jgi:8-oxo-dGDP phosphatase
VPETGAADVIADSVGSWPVRRTSILAQGKIVTLRRDTVVLPDGDVVDREVVEHPGAVAVVAMDESGRVLLIRQYRHPVGATLWELPAGLRDVAGEPLLDTARRELLEEASYRANDWALLTDYLSSPGITNERLRIFLARDLIIVPPAQREYVPEHEEAYLAVAWVALEDAVRAILAGELHNGVAMAGILAAYAAQADGFSSLRQAGDAENL